VIALEAISQHIAGLSYAMRIDAASIMPVRCWSGWSMCWVRSGTDSSDSPRRLAAPSLVFIESGRLQRRPVSGYLAKSEWLLAGRPLSAWEIGRSLMPTTSQLGVHHLNLTVQGFGERYCRGTK
jgi:hypothetical protein